MKENVKDAILALLKDSGYTGFDGKKYYAAGLHFNNIEKLLKHLSAKIQSSSEYPEARTEILACLVTKDYSPVAPIAQSIRYAGRSNKDPGALPTDPKIWEGLMCVKDIESKDQSPTKYLVLINPETRKIYRKYDPRAYLSYHGISPEDIVANPRLNAIFRFRFKQREFIMAEEYDGRAVTVINTCEHPFWFEMDVEPGIPEPFRKVIWHLLPDEKAREFVFDWIYHCLTDRADTALVLAGKMGTGKGVFSNIIYSLIGPSQVEIVGQSFVGKEFNAAMFEKRLVAIEESSFEDEEAKDNVKRLMNSKISIERKGHDSFTTENSSSFIIMSNHISIGFVPDDRRFSVPEITEVPLADIMSGDEIGAIEDGLKTLTEEWKENLARFGHFIISRTPKYSRTTPYKEEYFYRLTIESLSNWKKEIFDYFATGKYKGNGEAIKLTSILKNSGTKGVQRKSLTHFLDSFKFMNKYKIASPVYSADDKVKEVLIEPNMKFLEFIKTIDRSKFGINMASEVKSESISLGKKKVVETEGDAGDLL